MNIFVLDYKPSEAAKCHVDKHVGKQLLEAAQMLCTCLNVKAGKKVAPYKTAHPNHPCTKWVMESEANFLWLVELSTELHKEFIHRRGKSHKSFEVVKFCLENIPEFDRQELTPFALAMDEEYRKDCPVESYRDYYNNSKKHLHQWSKRNAPSWIK
jgi:hypothetical protein